MSLGQLSSSSSLLFYVPRLLLHRPRRLHPRGQPRGDLIWPGSRCRYHRRRRSHDPSCASRVLTRDPPPRPPGPRSQRAGRHCCRCHRRRCRRRYRGRWQFLSYLRKEGRGRRGGKGRREKEKEQGELHTSMAVAPTHKNVHIVSYTTQTGAT